MNILTSTINNDHNIRFLPNVFPWHGHICNYGALPQTWENPFHQVLGKLQPDRSKASSIQDQWTGKIGDKDPVDVCEIGTLPRPTGTVMPVRFLSY